MALSPFEKKVVELRFSERERVRELERAYAQKVLRPVWWVGMVAAYLYSLSKYFLPFPILIPILFGVWVLAVILYLDLWRLPKKKREGGIFSRLKLERRVWRGVILFAAIQLSHLLNFFLYYILFVISNW